RTWHVARVKALANDRPAAGDAEPPHRHLRHGQDRPQDRSALRILRERNRLFQPQQIRSALRLASSRMLLDKFSALIGSAPSNWFGGVYGEKDQHGRAAGGGVGGNGSLP